MPYTLNIILKLDFIYIYIYIYIRAHTSSLWKMKIKSSPCTRYHVFLAGEQANREKRARIDRPPRQREREIVRIDACVKHTRERETHAEGLAFGAIR